MRVLLSIALTAVSWGVYGPLLRRGSEEMGGGPWRPFICVGIAYFLIAVLAPAVLLKLKPEPSDYSATGALWSAAAGVAGAVGALGVILALTSGGSPIYVMPSVFGGAPVVSTFVTICIKGSHRDARPMLYAGVTLVVAGMVAVLNFSPVALHKPPAEVATASAGIVLHQLPKVLTFTALTALCWGIYGPVLHQGQSLMRGSRLRPFMMVGSAYFIVAAVLPFAVLIVAGDQGEFTLSGSIWGLAGGFAGALGALGVILAFTFGGKPVYVMPLVFGGAPIVNTFISTVTSNDVAAAAPGFYLGLVAVVIGAVTVLSFAPHGAPHDATPQPAVES